jgi:hypothetical protein
MALFGILALSEPEAETARHAECLPSSAVVARLSKRLHVQLDLAVAFNVGPSKQSTREKKLISSIQTNAYILFRRSPSSTSFIHFY